MNKINVRKLKHMLNKYKKAAIFVAMLAVVGIGIGVAHVLAVSVAIKCANLELSKNGFYNIGDEGNKYTFNAEVSGLTVGGDVTKNQFSWDTDRSTLISRLT